MNAQNLINKLQVIHSLACDTSPANEYIQSTEVINFIFIDQKNTRLMNKFQSFLDEVTKEQFNTELFYFDIPKKHINTILKSFKTNFITFDVVAVLANILLDDNCTDINYCLEDLLMEHYKKNGADKIVYFFYETVDLLEIANKSADEAFVSFSKALKDISERVYGRTIAG
jgi:hypothetical protein